MNTLTKQLQTNPDYFKSKIVGFIESPDFNFNYGSNWYEFANRDIDRILDKFFPAQVKFNRIEIMLITSILSPANRWQQNLIDLESFIRWSIEGLKPESRYKFSTYGKNVTKAKGLYFAKYSYKHSLNEWFFTGLSNWIKENMSAKKTFNFYLHLINPSSDCAFTIDRHMLKMAGIESVAITPKQYDLLKDIYLEVFSSYHEEFRYVSNFQSVLWANYVFQKHGILHY